MSRSAGILHIAMWEEPAVRMVVGMVVVSVGLVLCVPQRASAQSFELHGAAGPTLIDRGYSVAAGVGLSPGSIWAVAVDVERTHVSSRTTTDARGGVSSFRGGSLTLGTAELRVVPFGSGRIGPYGLVGFAAGRSEPNVNEVFPQPSPNDVRAMFAGGGLNLPVGERTRLFADVRWMLGADDDNGMVAVVPLRAGLAWRF